MILTDDDDDDNDDDDGFRANFSFERSLTTQYERVLVVGL
jgi:hypothetical protein